VSHGKVDEDKAERLKRTRKYGYTFLILGWWCVSVGHSSCLAISYVLAEDRRLHCLKGDDFESDRISKVLRSKRMIAKPVSTFSIFDFIGVSWLVLGVSGRTMKTGWSSTKNEHL